MLSSISGRHFAGHLTGPSGPAPTGVSLFYSLPNNSYPGTGDTLYDLTTSAYNMSIPGNKYYNSVQPRSLINANYLNWTRTMPLNTLLIATNTTTNFDWWFKSPSNWQPYPAVMFSYRDITTLDGIEIKLGGLNRLHLNSITQASSVEQLGVAYAIPMNNWALVSVVIDRPYNDIILYVNGVENMRRNLVAPYRQSQMSLFIDMVKSWNGAFGDFQMSYGPGGNTRATKYAAERAYYGV
jgi:hypothetical protein